MERRNVLTDSGESVFRQSSNSSQPVKNEEINKKKGGRKVLRESIKIHFKQPLSVSSEHSSGRSTLQPRGDELVKFSGNRQEHGLTIFFPIIFHCKDGSIFVLPGDDLYQKETLEEVRLKTKKSASEREFFKRGQQFLFQQY